MTFLNRRIAVFFILALSYNQALWAQPLSSVWLSDLSDGTYRNPIIHADYSDPDICRVGDDFYMTASSFNAIPGLPILHSTDLVNWRLIAYALHTQIPEEHFSKPQHGNGVWAPALRYHNNEFYIYWGDPDFGIYMVKSSTPEGPWEKPILVEGGKGLIDPCPLWDDDGNAYIVHAYAGSRAGIKSILVVKPMNFEGTRITGAGKLVFDGHDAHPTVEGSKFYKRNGYYYIFAPAGGVTHGWQLAMRARHPYGPYEERIVLARGNTEINGPHQGGWVELDNGENWFVHFQDKGPYGRIVHLQPMIWKNDWPVIGEDLKNAGTGQPVPRHKKPGVNKVSPIMTPPDSDDFEAHQLGLQWQWHGNPKATWAFIHPGKKQLRLFTEQRPAGSENLWAVPNLLLQKFPAETFRVDTRLQFTPNERLTGERVGLIVMGLDYAYLAIVKKEDGLYLSYNICNDAENQGKEKEIFLTRLKDFSLHLRVEVGKEGICKFSYSENGKRYIQLDEPFSSKPGKWIGAKVGLFALRENTSNDAGFADVDWFRFSPVK
ncbi:MAG: glycoside hydrolase 43 family protein [Cyclobacteriaceae bacterium]|nr:glycoside hydrolase 43 family protein [Cyclobacteriaceae bacterium]